MHKRFFLKPSEIYNSFNENGVISDIGALPCQLGQGAEEGAAAGNVHLTDGSLERRGADVRSEGVDDVLPVILVQKHQGYLRKRKIVIAW